MSEFMGCQIFYSCVTYKVSGGVQKGKPLCNGVIPLLQLFLGFWEDGVADVPLPRDPQGAQVSRWKCGEGNLTLPRFT